MQTKPVVLALKNAVGSHTGDNIAERLVEMLHDYHICDRVTYFAADDDTNNDKFLRLLIRNLGIDSVKQRLASSGVSHRNRARRFLHARNGLGGKLFLVPSRSHHC